MPKILNTIQLSKRKQNIWMNGNENKYIKPNLIVCPLFLVISREARQKLNAVMLDASNKEFFTFK
jgi:hypothetical protein